MAESPTVGTEIAAPEAVVARDLARRAALVAPVLAAVAAAFWGAGGALSALYAVAVVGANFLVAAGLMAWSAPLGLGFFMGTVLVSYVLRLALVAGAVLAITGTWWFEPVPLGFTLVVAHLGLLAWETRYVSASLAYPALKPRPRRPVPRAGSPEAPHKETTLS